MTVSNTERHERLEKLRSLYLLDTPADPAFDRLTRLATQILKTPISLVSLVDADRQFFKSFVGLPEPWATTRETPLSHSFCQHVVATGQPLVISDARTDPLVQDNLAIRDLDVIAYAGMPLLTSDGFGLGSFCVISPEPRVWTDDELSILSDLATSVMTEIELQEKLRERDEVATHLEVSEERYRLISELMSDYAFSTKLDDSGNVKMDWITGDSFQRVTGYTIEEVAELPRASMMIDEYIDQAFADADATLKGEKRQGVYQIKTKQGDLRWLRVNRFPRWNDSHDQVIGFYGIAHDITEEQLIQEQQQQLVAEQERTRALRQFITDVSHDFNTPLTIIQTSLYLLKKTIDSEKHSRINLISEQATRLETLVENLILMSRLDDSNEWSFNALEINSIVKDLRFEISSQAVAKGIEVDWQLAEPLPNIDADSTYLLLALEHLVDNAIQFTPPNQSIIVRTYRDAENVIFEVEDNGIGISEDNLPKIFERFFRADPARSSKGGGMGLAIVKLIVEMHRGTIEVESVVDQGSLFRLRLPILLSNSADK